MTLSVAEFGHTEGRQAGTAVLEMSSGKSNTPVVTFMPFSYV